MKDSWPLGRLARTSMCSCCVIYFHLMHIWRAKRVGCLTTCSPNLSLMSQFTRLNIFGLRPISCIIHFHILAVLAYRLETMSFPEWSSNDSLFCLRAMNNLTLYEWMNGWTIEWLIDWIELVTPLSKIDILPWFAGWSVLWPLQHILFLAQDRGIQKRLTRILISQDSLCDVWSASSPYRHEMRITEMCGGRFVTLFFCLFGSRVFPNYRKETRIACAMFGRLPFFGPQINPCASRPQAI